MTVNATSLFTCGIAGQTVTCINGRVNAGSNATITINGTIAAAAAGDLENTSVVDPGQHDRRGHPREHGGRRGVEQFLEYGRDACVAGAAAGHPVSIFFDKQGPATAIPGQLIRYTLDYHERDASDAPTTSR